MRGAAVVACELRVSLTVCVFVWVRGCVSGCGCVWISEVGLPAQVVDLVHAESDDVGLHAAASALQRLSQLMAAPARQFSRRKLAKIRNAPASPEDVRDLCLVAEEHLRSYLPAAQEGLLPAHLHSGGAHLPAVSPRTISTITWAAAKLGYRSPALFELAVEHARCTGLER